MFKPRVVQHTLSTSEQLHKIAYEMRKAAEKLPDVEKRKVLLRQSRSA
jgi:hypothetical protein